MSIRDPQRVYASMKAVWWILAYMCDGNNLLKGEYMFL